MSLVNLLDPAPKPDDLRIVDYIAGRVSWVQILAAGATITGLLLIFTGGLIVPFATTFAGVPGWPWFWGAILAVGGTVLLWALPAQAHRTACLTAVAIGLAYFVMASGFAALVIIWWRDDVPNNAIPPYPAAVYLTMAAMHFLHADMEGRAWRRTRARRARAKAR